MDVVRSMLKYELSLMCPQVVRIQVGSIVLFGGAMIPNIPRAFGDWASPSSIPLVSMPRIRGLAAVVQLI